MKNTSNKIVSVIIVTAGRGDYLKLCLNSLKQQVYLASEVIVIDNSLNQDFIQKIKADYPFIRVYSSLQNLFYCQALNTGINMSGGEFVLCLNDDVVLDERYILKALEAFKIDKRIGMASGKILRPDKKTLDSAGLFLSIWRTAKERGYGEEDKGRFEKQEYIFGVNGAVAFYRRKMLKSVKTGAEYFDQDYRIFYEDLDVAWRANNLGWRGYYIPEAIAYHSRGGTVRGRQAQGKPFARRFLSQDLHWDLIKNRYLTIAKNESWRGFILFFPFILAHDLALFLYVIIFKPAFIIRFIKNFHHLGEFFLKRKKTKQAQALKSHLSTEDQRSYFD